MGCDIHTFIEERRADGEWVLMDPETVGEEIFGWRDYGVFGFLADVRNYSHVPVIAEPRGIPADVSAELRAEHKDWGIDAHSASWLTVSGLLAYDYDQMFLDRRIQRTTYNPISGGSVTGDAALAEEGEGKHFTLREFLGESFFRDLNRLTGFGVPEQVRIVFWFDN